VARLLIVGGGCRGRLLAAELVAEGHAVRIVTRSESRRPEIEAGGAECVIADPDRLGTLRPALEAVTVACWLLATASGPRPQVDALHGARLEQFVHQLIDTTARGLVYEAPSLSSAAATLDSSSNVITDRGEADEGEADEGEADEGEADEGTADEGTADEGEADEGTADPGTADEGRADPGTARGVVAPDVVIEGRRIATALAEHNAIPLSVIAADPADRDGWLADARAAVDSLLGLGRGQSGAGLRTTA
jgi:NAD(P)H-binding